MKIALLGLAQSGKKTLFALLTGRQPALLAPARAEEPLEGLAPIHDPRVLALANIIKPARVKFAEHDIVLCPDISETSGQRPWLAAARRCDLLCLVIRAFGAAEVYHPRGTVDAARDRQLLEAELLLADLELIETRLTRLAREKRAGISAAQAQEEQTLSKIKEILEREMKWTPISLAAHELEPIKSLNLLVLKPLLGVYNVDESALVQGAAPSAQGVLAASCRIEQEIMALDSAADKKAYLETLGLSGSGLDRFNQAAYAAMGLLSFYTVINDEVRAWTIRRGTAAPAAAGKVHSDIERGFIRVEVIKYDDLLAAGSESAAKTQGKAQVRGRDYIIADGDICRFRFNV